ncbi:MAG: secretin and TonB N-terminal domain-containing protein, partial [Parcubacteria group bacterium]
MSARGKIYSALLGGVAAAALLAGAARAEDIALNIAPQPLGDALNEFAVQSKHSVVFAPGLVAQKTSPGVTSAATAELALAELLDGSGLSYRRNGDTFLIVSASDPQSGSAAGDDAEGTVAALVVTAQKREENIQDVPIAISAFTEKSLQEQKIEGGFDLLKAIPNVTFSKNNFTSYNFSIRGVGTKAISATTDPGVAVSFNNVSLIQNRLFEQEYFDVERV